jgi:hypothetical protein
VRLPSPHVWQDQRDADRRKLLEAAEMMVPESLPQLLPFVTALAGTTNHARLHGAAAAACADYAAAYLAQLPYYTETVPVAAAIAAGALALENSEQNDMFDDGERAWVAYVRTTGPWPLAGGALQLAPGTYGVLVRPSADDLAFICGHATALGVPAPTARPVTVRWRADLSGFALVWARLQHLCDAHEQRSSGLGGWAADDVAVARDGLVLMAALGRQAAAYPRRRQRILSHVWAGMRPGAWTALHVVIAHAVHALARGTPSGDADVAALLTTALNASAALMPAVGLDEVVAAVYATGLVTTSPRAPAAGARDGGEAERSLVVAAQAVSVPQVVPVLSWAHAVIARVCWPAEGVGSALAAATHAETRTHAEAIVMALLTYALEDVLGTASAGAGYAGGSGRDRTARLARALALLDAILVRVPTRGTRRPPPPTHRPKHSTRRSYPLGALGLNPNAITEMTVGRASPLLFQLQQRVVAFFHQRPRLAAALVALACTSRAAIEVGHEERTLVRRSGLIMCARMGLGGRQLPYVRGDVESAKRAETLLCASLTLLARLLALERCRPSATVRSPHHTGARGRRRRHRFDGHTGRSWDAWGVRVAPGQVPLCVCCKSRQWWVLGWA